ncbi:MAG TPA: NADH-quinone oxidoreductase subunit C [Ignavibacteriaceae bacterium]|nr:NADH-quinone oxidoreductase subunit C [Ignavibacteriaceae bacterium]
MDNFQEFISKMNDKIGKKIQKPRRLYFEVENENILEVADYLFKKLRCRLSTATGQETYRGIEVLYHFSNDKTGDYYCPRIVMKDKSCPKMNSISSVVVGAEWIEREMMEMLGITFDGHPHPEPLLTGNHPKEIKIPWRFKVSKT